jgi:1-acyl-sn-glycerol-3-phosphate acyltransferase
VPDPVYHGVNSVVKSLFRVLGIRFDISGLENLPAGGAVVLINHVSYLDFCFAGYAADRARPRRLVRFMAKDSVFRHRLSGPLMRGMHHIPVDREAGASAYRSAVAALRAGELVGVFPEATISRSFQLKDFKSGAARMAIEAGVSVVPVVLWGGQRLFTKGRPRSLRRGVAVTVAVGTPVLPAPGADPAVLTAAVRDTMAGMLDRLTRSYPQSPAGPDDLWWLPVAHGGTAPTPAEAAALDEADVAARRARRAGGAAA